MDVGSRHDPVTVVDVNLGFSRAEDVIADHEGRGLKRAITRPVDHDFDQRFEYRRCRIRDWSAPGQPRPGFRAMGFETIDLGRRAPLQSLLAADQAGRSNYPGASETIASPAAWRCVPAV